MKKYKFNREASASLKNKYSKLIAKFSEDEKITSKVAMALIYLKLGRDAKAESVLSSIMDKEYLYYAFQQEKNEIENEKISEYFIDYLNQISDLLKNEKLIDNLTAYLAIELEGNERELLVDDFSIPNRLSYVQEHTKSISYGLYYPHVWSFWLEKYSSTEELRNFLKRGGIKEQIEKNPSNISLLYSYFPLDKNFRDLIFKSYSKLLTEEDFYRKDIAIRMNENIGFINDLTMRKQKKPNFVLKRNHYNKTLMEKKSIYYSIYNLIKLGEIKPDFIPYLLAVKSYGL